ncbi:amidohydrolase [Bacteroidota bacterium]
MKPLAEAVAVIGERIVAVGDKAEINSWKGPNTQVIDAGGKLLMPGFNDAHVHMLSGGRQLDYVQLKDADTPEEFARRIAERAKNNPEGEWILGGDWDEQRWDPSELPTKNLIDSVTPSTPVFVIRYDGHMALINSVTLRLAGITAATPDPLGGKILRDENGNPTGVLKVSAMELVRKHLPPETATQRNRAVKRAFEHAASLGITSVQDMTTSNEDIATFLEMEEKGELTARVSVAPRVLDWNDQAILGIRNGFGSPYLRFGMVKGFVDGSIGSTTALFFEPYTEAPGTYGFLTEEILPLDETQERLIKIDRAGLQICLHAVGDKGNSITLDFLERIEEANGQRDRRYRIEHAQHLVPEDFDRFAEMNVIASVQPYHAIDDGRFVEARIGHERSKTTYAFRTFIDKDVKLALGTDWNGAPLEPMLTLYAAVTRATLDGKHPDGWFPEQKITMEEAVEAYTLGAAYAEFQEKEKGSITPGKLADMIIVSEDIFNIDPVALPEVKVEMTMVGGKVVYSAAR